MIDDQHVRTEQKPPQCGTGAAFGCGLWSQEGLSEDTAQLLVLLLGSPIAWAAALRGVGGSGRGVVQQRLRLRNQVPCLICLCSLPEKLNVNN